MSDERLANDADMSVTVNQIHKGPIYDTFGRCQWAKVRSYIKNQCAKAFNKVCEQLFEKIQSNKLLERVQHVIKPCVHISVIRLKSQIFMNLRLKNVE